MLTIWVGNNFIRTKNESNENPCTEGPADVVDNLDAFVVDMLELWLLDEGKEPKKCQNAPKTLASIGHGLEGVYRPRRVTINCTYTG